MTPENDRTRREIGPLFDEALARTDFQVCELKIAGHRPGGVYGPGLAWQILQVLEAQLPAALAGALVYHGERAAPPLERRRRRDLEREILQRTKAMVRAAVAQATAGGEARAIWKSLVRQNGRNLEQRLASLAIAHFKRAEAPADRGRVAHRKARSISAP